jgi:hypothetical protein
MKLATLWKKVKEGKRREKPIKRPCHQEKKMTSLIERNFSNGLKSIRW